MYLKQILLSLDLGHRNIEYCYFLCREYINSQIIVRQIVKKGMDQIKTLK